MSQRNRQPKEPIAALPAYPIMPITDIGNTLDALGIPSTIEDLSKPTGPGVQMIYAALLDVLMSAPVEMIEGPKAMLMGGLEYKELYGDALSFTMFFSHCRTLAGICGIEDFRMSDLTRPEPARFRSQMSGIMNFAKFREERTHAQSNLAARNQQQKDEVARLHHELSRVEQEIEEIKAKHAQDKPLTEQAGTRNEALRQALYDLRVEQVRISAVTEDLKAARQAVMDSAAQRTHELTTLQSQNASAKSRLVQSPERIKKHISEMSFTVSQERASLQSHQRKARELAHRLEVIGGMEVDLRGLIDLEKGIEVQRARVEEARRGVMSLRGKVESQQIEGKSMEVKLGQLERQLQHAQEKLSRQKEAFEDTKAKAATRYSNLREAYVHEATARKVWQRERDQLLAEKKAIEDEMADFVAHHEAEINAMLQEYWTMRKQAEDYMNTVTVKLGLELR